MHNLVCCLFVCVWYLKALPFGGAFLYKATMNGKRSTGKMGDKMVPRGIGGPTST